MIGLVLASPQFFYHMEYGQPDGPESGLVQLSPYELAARLSYHFWDEPPDAELWEVAANGTLLSTYYYVGRAGKTLQRVPLVRSTEVMGIVEKPRRLFLMTDVALGTPVFDPQGKVLGVTLRYFANGRQAGIVVLPSEDIAEMAKQAAAVQAKPAPDATSKPAADAAPKPEEAKE